MKRENYEPIVVNDETIKPEHFDRSLYVSFPENSILGGYENNAILKTLKSFRDSLNPGEKGLLIVDSNGANIDITGSITQILFNSFAFTRALSNIGKNTNLQLIFVMGDETKGVVSLRNQVSQNFSKLGNIHIISSPPTQEFLTKLFEIES
jgi:hypothetical protein